MRVVDKVISDGCLLSLQVVSKRHNHVLKFLDSFFGINLILVRVLQFCLRLVLSVLLNLYGTAQHVILLANTLVVRFERDKRVFNRLLVLLQRFNHGALLLDLLVEIRLGARGATRSTSASFERLACQERAQMSTVDQTNDMTASHQHGLRTPLTRDKRALLLFPTVLPTVGYLKSYSPHSVF